MSEIVDQIADDGDSAAILRAMADVYQRYGRDAADVPTQVLPAQPLPAQRLAAEDLPVGSS